MSHASQEEQMASYDHGHPHSHKKHYFRVAAILTIVTALELGIPFLKELPEFYALLKEVWAPLLVGMSLFKFAAVVGEFMHLREDRAIYKVVFIAPMVLAIGCLSTVAVLAVVHYAPFGKGYMVTNVDMRAGYVPPSVGQMAEPAWSEDKLLAAFKTEEGEKFAKGNKIYVEKCAACHGDKGQGTVGPNMTDNCYIHGGKLADMYTTIRNGVPTASPAMPAWGAQLKAEEIREVTAFMRSMRGTNAPGGKPCQGTPVTD